MLEQATIETREGAVAETDPETDHKIGGDPASLIAELLSYVEAWGKLHVGDAAKDAGDGCDDNVLVGDARTIASDQDCILEFLDDLNSIEAFVKEFKKLRRFFRKTDQGKKDRAIFDRLLKAFIDREQQKAFEKLVDCYKKLRAPKKKTF